MTKPVPSSTHSLTVERTAGKFRLSDSESSFLPIRAMHARVLFQFRSFGGVVSPEELRSLVGHRFPGGRYTIAHWENWLLTDCTGAEQLPDGRVHPIALFHVPILGARTSIAELFALLQASGAGSVSLLGYDWEYFQPLIEDTEYRCEGGIISAERSTADDGRVADTVAFQIELFDEAGVLVARITNRWRLNRMVA